MKDLDKIREFIKLKTRKKNLNVELRMIEQDLGELETHIFEKFIADGVSGMTVDGKPVFLKKQIYVSPARFDGDDTDTAYARTCKTLKDVGLGELVSPRYNANTLSAYVREQLNDGGELPEELKKVLKISERHAVGVSGA